MNVVCTALGADYPRMGSFGSADDFAFGVAAGMTRPKPKYGAAQYSYITVGRCRLPVSKHTC